jgi:hypothetical protein
MLIDVSTSWTYCGRSGETIACATREWVIPALVRRFLADGSSAGEGAVRIDTRVLKIVDQRADGRARGEARPRTAIDSVQTVESQPPWFVNPGHIRHCEQSGNIAVKTWPMVPRTQAPEESHEIGSDVKSRRLAIVRLPHVGQEQR